VDTDDLGVVAPGPWLAWHLDAMEPGPGSLEFARATDAAQAFVHGPHLGAQFQPKPTVPSVQVWADHSPGSLDQLGLDPATVVTETVQRTAVWNRLTGELVDQVLARAGS